MVLPEAAAPAAAPGHQPARVGSVEPPTHGESSQNIDGLLWSGAAIRSEVGRDPRHLDDLDVATSEGIVTRLAMPMPTVTSKPGRGAFIL